MEYSYEKQVIILLLAGLIALLVCAKPDLLFSQTQEKSSLSGGPPTPPEQAEKLSKNPALPASVPPKNSPAAVPTPPVPPTPEEQQRLLLTTKYEILLEDALRFMTKQREKEWQWLILGGAYENARLYQEYSALFSAKAAQEVRQYLDIELDPLKKRATRYLLDFIRMGCLARAKAESRQKIEIILESSHAFEGLAPVSLLALRQLWPSQTDDLARQKLIQASQAEFAAVIPEWLKMLQTDITTPKNLGFDSLPALLLETSGDDLARWQPLAQKFLAASEKPYLQLLQMVAAKELAKDIPDLTLADLGRILGSKRFDAAFPEKKLIESARDMLLDLQFELATQTQLEIHLFNAPTKKPLPRCIPLSIPSDVRLSCSPAAGPQTRSDFFFLMGQAQFYLAINTTTPEFRHFKLEPPAQLAGRLFQSLLENPLWLEKRVRMSKFEQTDYRRLMALRRLYEARLVAAQLLLSLDLNPALSSQKLSPNMARILAETIKVRLDGDEYAILLADIPDIATAMSTLKVLWLLPHFSGYLSYNFGPDWFIQPYARSYLQSLWQAGSAKDFTDMSELRLEQLSYEAFLGSIEETIKNNL
jgi:hypothetical protein